MGWGGGMGHFHGLDEDVKITSLSREAIHQIWEWVRPYVWLLVAAVALMLVVSATAMLGPYLISVAIDNDIANKNLAGVGIIGLYYALLYLANWAATYGQQFIMSWVGQSIVYDIRQQLFTHLQRLGLPFHDRMQAGRVMSRVTNDVDALQNILQSGVTTVISDLTTLIGIIGIMLWMNWQLALVTFITIPILLAVVLFFQRRLVLAYHRVRRRMADVNANLQESISGMRVTQAFAREDVNMQVFDGINASNFTANVAAARLEALFMPSVELISALGTSLVLWYGGVGIHAVTLRLGTTNIFAARIGVLVAFLSYVTRFFMPIRELTQVYSTFLQAGVSTDRIVEIMSEEPTVTELPSAYPLPPVKGHVVFDHVTFGYNPEEPVLHDVCLEAKPGETIALVGPTGAGKTSIITLLARFYDPQAGRILIDGHDIRAVTLSSLRRQMGTVLQDNFIFSGTIRENIRYGRLDATDEEVEMAARMVNAHEFIMRLPQGYDTDVGERGSRISIGQRQLLAFARAVLADPRILILDEATSNVDAYTELLIQKAVEKLLQGRTAVVIAHRLSTVRNADRIYVIDGGRVVEYGTHEELLSRGGRYRELYDKQFASMAEAG